MSFGFWISCVYFGFIGCVYFCRVIGIGEGLCFLFRVREVKFFLVFCKELGRFGFVVMCSYGFY